MRPCSSASRTISSTVARSILRTVDRNAHWSAWGRSSSSRKTLLPSSRGSLLQRQGDQVAETALGQRVLIGKEAVVGIQADVRPAFHRFGQEVRTEPAGQARREWPRSKNSQTCPPLPDRDRSRAAGKFSRRHVSRTAAASSRQCGLVEVGRQEEAGFVPQHGINAHDEVAAVVVLARKGASESRRR